MIKTFSISQFTNPLHLQFMDYVVTLVLDKDPTSLNVKPQHDLLSQKVTELKGLYKSVQGHPLSVQILEADALRDKILVGITKGLEASTFHYNETMVTAANLLKKNVKVYGTNIAKNDLQTETVKIESLVNDWRTKSELTSAMTTLELGDWITELENANNEFKRLYALRTDDYSQQTNETMRTKRIEVNMAYDELCKFLNSYSVINNSDPAYEAVISGINTYVDQYDTLLKQKKSHKTEKAVVK